MKTYVNEVKKKYDYVLIDSMPSLGIEVSKWRFIMIPSTPITV